MSPTYIDFITVHPIEDGRWMISMEATRDGIEQNYYAKSDIELSGIEAAKFVLQQNEEAFDEIIIVKPYISTQNAFLEMIIQPGIAKKLGILRTRVSEYRRKPPKVETQEELLRKAGWKKQPENWIRPE